MNDSLIDETELESRPPPAPPSDGKTVRVELVWPEERGAKDDCKGHTKVVWTGKGDIQEYPAELWSKLAPHTDVWRLVSSEDKRVAALAENATVETPQRKVERLNRESAALRGLNDTPSEADRKAAEEAAERGAETGTDTVYVSGTPLDEEQLAAMTDDEVHAAGEARGMRLHARLSPVNLRAKFLELQSGV